MPDCSIIIVTYNGWPLVRQCLDALRVELRPGVDVVVVDNGSVDGTPAKIRSTFSWVKVVEPGRNLGFAAGNNLGIQDSASEFVLLVNSDVFVRPGFVDAMLAPFADSTRLGSVAATMVFQSRPERVASAGIDVFSNGLALDRAVGERLDSLTDRAPVFGASAGAAMFRRAALVDVGLFPESFFMYLEDVDLAWRLRLGGWESVLATDAVAEHAYSASAAEGSRFKRSLLARNRVWYIVRCYPRWLLARHWWRIAAYDLMVIASAGFRRDGASVMGRVSSLRGIGARMAERADIQDRATATRADLERWVRPSPPTRRLLELRRLTRAYAMRRR